MIPRCCVRTRFRLGRYHAAPQVIRLGVKCVVFEVTTEPKEVRMSSPASVNAAAPSTVPRPLVTRRERFALAAVTLLVFTTTGFLTADAADTGSVFTPISPQRLLDTRTNVGLAGPFTSDQPRSLDVTGNVAVVLPGNSIGAATVVPDGATGIVANITAVSPTTIGYVAVRPATATGEPTTSNINFTTPGAIVPNSVTVELPVGGAADVVGHIQLWFHGTDPAATTHILVDIVGYYSAGAGGGPQGPIGPQGPTGPVGPAGTPATGHSTSALDAGTNVIDTAVVIGTNGNPIISYYDNTNDDLKVAACNNPTCTTSTNSVLDSGGNVGYDPSITVGANGNPVISYWDSSNNDLKVATCSNPTCVGVATLTTVENGGLYSSITIGTNGNPVISFYDTAPNSDLKVTACNNPTCTSATTTLLDSVGNVGLDTSIAIGTNGNPIISYWDATSDDLKVAACNNPTCTSATITPVDTAGEVGAFNSIAIGTNGNPVISYFQAVAVDLKIAACNDPSCTSATITPIDTASNVGQHSSITIGTNGNPIISYLDLANLDLKIAACNNPTCTTANATPVNVNGSRGFHTSITIGTDGNPVVSYMGANNDLNVTTCGNPTCTNYPARRR